MCFQRMLLSGVCQLCVLARQYHSQHVLSTVNDMIYIVNVRSVFIKYSLAEHVC